MMIHNNPKFIEQIHQQASKVEAWLDTQWQKNTPPFYCSVDLRYSGFKLTGVDTNLFSAGFNLLSPAAQALATQAFQDYSNSLGTKKISILIIPESHTRNIGYLENVAALEDIIQSAGIEVRVGSLLKEITSPTPITLPSGKILTLLPLIKENHQLKTQNFQPSLILLNHDLSGEVPHLLQNIEQPILPPLKAGWSTRQKTKHFQHHRDVIEEFAQSMHLDPWLLFPFSDHCEKIDFTSQKGIECIEQKAHTLLAEIQKKYDEYQIAQSPFLIIKSDTGTYGMGIMTLKSPEDIQHLNRKAREHMAYGKGGVETHRVLIQEGVYTAETASDHQGAAEPVIYLMNQKPIGGFYRIHPDRSTHENLNSPGMYFSYDRLDQLAKENPARFYVYQVAAQLSALAASRELKEMAA